MKEIIQNFKPYIDSDLPLQVQYIGESFCDETFYFKRNNYEAYSLEYIIDGEGTLNINGKTYHPKSGEIFFLSKHSKHEYFSQKENPWHKIYILFNGFLADELVRGYIPENSYVFTVPETEDIFKEIYKIASEKGENYREKHDIIIPKIVEIFLKIKNSGTSEATDLAHKIKKSLDMNLQKSYTLKELASELNYTDNHLINIFRERFGETPYQYYSKNKIRLAGEYLVSTQLSIGEIAEMLCYTDPQYFSACFKKNMGVTPCEYRKRER